MGSKGRKPRKPSHSQHLKKVGDRSDYAHDQYEEREAVLRDLAQTREFKLVLEPRGILGITFICEDCDEMHFYDWDIMINNMIAILNSQLPPVHEPSAQPNFQAYVPWDYALGYLDGLDAR